MALSLSDSDQKQFFEGQNIVLARMHVCHGAPHQLHEDLVVRLVEFHVERLRIIVTLLCTRNFMCRIHEEFVRREKSPFIESGESHIGNSYIH